MKSLAREIGSEFWNIELAEKTDIQDAYPHQYLLTGRTALDFIIKDIRAASDFKRVYLPSFCCHTMIVPFLENGISVEFYDITFHKGQYQYEIDFNTASDVVLILQYFGFHNSYALQMIERLKNIGKIIIEDATHSWLTSAPYCSQSDYVFTSFRKWTGLACGAYVIKQNGEPFKNTSLLGTNSEYIELRQKAAKLKRQYIEEGIGEKEEFLQLFSRAEDLLDSDYRDYSVPIEYMNYIQRLELDKLRECRRSNAKYLIDQLQRFYEIETVELKDQDVPLFVPIYIKNGTRNDLRRYLIQRDIYCPVHWPLSDKHLINDTVLYDTGLSLICDQRYSLADMERIIASISEYYGG